MHSAQAGVPVPLEARTGHGWDAVTEMLPGFVGRPDGIGAPPAWPPPCGGGMDSRCRIAYTYDHGLTWRRCP